MAVIVVTRVGLGDPSNNWLGSSVVERFACYEVVPGSIPGLAYSFLLLQMVGSETQRMVYYIVYLQTVVQV